MEKSKTVKKIDVHAHVTAFPEYAPPNSYTHYRMISPEELLGFYDKLDIEKGVLLPIVAPEAQFTPLTSCECKYVADKYPDRFIWFCNVDPRNDRNAPDADLSKLLMHYKSLGAKGFGELTTNIPADDPLMDNLFRYCAECDLPVTIHVAPMDKYGFYGIKDDLGLPRIEKMLKKYPKLKIFGHSQTFWSEISGDVDEQTRREWPTSKIKGEGRLTKLLREYPNLYCDLSADSGRNAFMRDPEHAARFIEEFSDRIMYGCDICATYNTHPFVFNEWLNKFREDGYISEENYYKFVRGNAIRILKLKEKE